MESLNTIQDSFRLPILLTVGVAKFDSSNAE